MPESYELNPTDHITMDAIGKPGQRIFYLQGWHADQVITLLIEKVQVQTLAIGVEQFIGEIAERLPDLPAAESDYDEEKMHILPPVDPLFRAGELGLMYDEESDRLILVAREIFSGEQTAAEASSVKFWCTRSQLRALSRWGMEVAGRGRPVCPYCGQPIDPEGHFCPKKNGHKH
jgi:uncharacterized repeat protein (TIGR03847 family)